jgi:hypothetical protein
MPKKTVVTRTELDGEELEPSDAEQFAEANPEVTLFSKEEVSDKRVEKLHITRTDPDEGYLGFMAPHATEQDIVQRWGGSEYSVIAKNASGRIVLSRKFRLAGDPVFVSDIFEARWRRMMGLKKKDEKSDKDPDTMSGREVMVWMQQQEASRRTDEAVRFERERERDREYQERVSREQREAQDRQSREQRESQERQAREQREHETKLEVQRREDAERREKEHSRELEKERTANAQLLQQNQQFFQTMLAMNKQANEGAAQSDPTAMLISGMEMAMKMHEGATPKDALTTVLERLPETLKEARETAAAAYREVSGGGKDKEAGAGGGKRDSLTIKGSLATKVKALVRHLVKQGKDPEKVIDGVADYLMKTAPPSSGQRRGKPGTRRAAAQRAATKTESKGGTSKGKRKHDPTALGRRAQQGGKSGAARP